MNDLIKYFVKSLASSTLTLKKKGILIDKPWAFLDEEGEIQKLIFKKDNGLILSKNGKVMEGSWDYFPEARALFINRGKDKLLLKEQFIDENVLILKKDGTDNDFYALANENSVPDYNIPKYLNSLKCKQFSILERKLLNGNYLQIYEASNLRYLNEFSRHSIELLDESYNSVEAPDGSYITDNKLYTYIIANNRISSIKQNIIKELTDGNSFEIQEGESEYIYNNLGKRVTLNGNPIPNTRLIDKRNFIYEIRESSIAEILYVIEYTLKDGSKIKIEQRDFNKIRKGDRIFNSTSNTPLHDGLYKIRGKWGKLKVINSIVQ